MMTKIQFSWLTTMTTTTSIILMIMMFAHDKHGVDAMALYKKTIMNQSNNDIIHSKSSTSEEGLGDRSRISRRDIFKRCFLTSTSTLLLLSSPPIMPNMNIDANAINIPEQKSYSSNARNMDRLSTGDSSAGSVYDNSPDLPVAAKRRAMIGCKVSPSRVEASRLLLEGDGNGKGRVQTLSEKECNMKVMGGDTEFMLKALRNLDCPTCPYGIEGA